MYSGEFVDDLREGNGTYTYANGESYNGEFSKDRKNGKGVYSWPAPNARSYDGYFENGTVVIREDTPAPDNIQNEVAEG